VQPGISVTPRLDALEAAIRVSLESREPEGPHQVRVNTRRIAAWLKLGDLNGLGEELRWLRGEGAELRDLDVLLASDPPQLWRTVLHKKRGLARRRFRGALRSARTASLLRALRELRPLPHPGHPEVLARMVRRARKAGLRARKGPPHPATYHRLRLRLKGLRYALEWMDQPTRGLRELQDALGQLNDTHAALERLEQDGLGNELSGYARTLLDRQALELKEASTACERLDLALPTVA
jgi:CHAD domain-containing protein